jgi:hypothetical protein
MQYGGETMFPQPSTTVLKPIRRSGMFLLRVLIILAVLAPNLADLLRPAQTALAAAPEVEQEADISLASAATSVLKAQAQTGGKARPEKSMAVNLVKKPAPGENSILAEGAVPDVLQSEPTAEVWLKCVPNSYGGDECEEDDVPARVVEFDEYYAEPEPSSFEPDGHVDTICSDGFHHTCGESNELITVYFEWSCIAEVYGLAGNANYQIELEIMNDGTEVVDSGVFCTIPGTPPEEGSCTGAVGYSTVRPFPSMVREYIPDIDMRVRATSYHDQVWSYCRWRASLDGFSGSRAAWLGLFVGAESACLVATRIHTPMAW